MMLIFNLADLLASISLSYLTRWFIKRFNINKKEMLIETINVDLKRIEKRNKLRL